MTLSKTESVIFLYIEKRRLLLYEVSPFVYGVSVLDILTTSEQPVILAQYIVKKTLLSVRRVF